MTTQNRRHFVRNTTALSLGAVWSSNTLSLAFPANNEIRLGFIGCGGRANELMSAFSKIEGVRTVALCDPDQAALDKSHKRFPTATTYQDLRKLLDNPEVDAVVVATCNHWHCLAAIWAMQAGKDVYVEKPLSHSQWEGEQTIAAARKYNKICQVGTQQRSDPMQAEIKKFLHEEQALGNILSARVNRYGVRPSIGKLEKPLVIDPSVAYDLWLGPAQDRPIFRNKLQYDWHWDFNTGSGEMGNWGVHVLDDLRNNVFRDSVQLPKRIMGAGARVVFNDAGETPNVHFAYFDTGSIPVVIGLSNIPNIPPVENKKSITSEHPGPASGYIAYCEGGRFEGQRGRGVAFDEEGKQIKAFEGTSGMGIHQQNFIDAVRTRDRSMLKAEVQVGHDSSGWCNLANIAFQAGKSFTMSDAKQLGEKPWLEMVDSMSALLKRHNLNIDSAGLRLSPLMAIDEKTQRFVGENSQVANQFIRREYRKGYEVLEIQA
jgi:predicted dehydrogenase